MFSLKEKIRKKVWIKNFFLVHEQRNVYPERWMQKSFEWFKILVFAMFLIKIQNQQWQKNLRIVEVFIIYKKNKTKQQQQKKTTTKKQNKT